MADLTTARVVALLREANRQAPSGDLRMYADAWILYQEAAGKVKAHGSVIQHPRTGQPMANPFCAVMAMQAKTMKSLPRVCKTDSLWEVIDG